MKSSISLKSTYWLLAIFLIFVFLQKEKHGINWAKTLDFLFQKHWIFFFRKKFVPWIKLFLNFYFSQVIVFIAFHLSKTYIQSKTKVRFYLTKNLQYFIWKTFDFLIKKKSCSWQKMFLNLKNIKNNFQFLQNLWKINKYINFFKGKSYSIISRGVLISWRKSLFTRFLGGNPYLQEIRNGE